MKYKNGLGLGLRLGLSALSATLVMYAAHLISPGAVMAKQEERVANPPPVEETVEKEYRAILPTPIVWIDDRNNICEFVHLWAVGIDEVAIKIKYGGKEKIFPRRKPEEFYELPLNEVVNALRDGEIHVMGYKKDNMVESYVIPGSPLATRDVYRAFRQYVTKAILDRPTFELRDKLLVVTQDGIMKTGEPLDEIRVATKYKGELEVLARGKPGEPLEIELTDKRIEAITYGEFQVSGLIRGKQAASWVSPRAVYAQVTNQIQQAIAEYETKRSEVPVQEKQYSLLEKPGVMEGIYAGLVALVVGLLHLGTRREERRHPNPLFDRY